MLKIVKVVLLSLILVALAGCHGTGKTVYCAKCDKDVKVGTYCPKCNMVVGYEGTVHCDKCNRDVPAGTYCAECNRFMLPGTVHCDKCNKDIPTGTYCDKCKAYAGVKGVAYCPGCKKPYLACKGCCCQKK